jgi:thymidylate synthase
VNYMKFQPLYYGDKVSDGNSFQKNNLNIVNSEGHSGIVTLWSKPWEIWDRLLERFPRLFEEDSPLVTLTSLYGNGLPQMLANLAHNPQIEFLAITGSERRAVPSSTYLLNFLKNGLDIEEGSQLGTIFGTSYALDPQLNPDMFEHLKVKRFEPGDLEGVVNFVTQESTYVPNETDRVKIELVEPEFSDYPSDITNHKISSKTPLEAWMEVMYTLNRFGENIQLEKGVRRTLFNLDVHIENPEPEREDELRKFNFDPDGLRSYREDMLKGELPEGTSYNYGNRLREHFGIDSLEAIIERLKKDPLDRRLFISLWDNKEDINPAIEGDSSVPCLTDLYFANNEGRLMLTANFRTHSAVSAWLMNLYGLRAIQEYVVNGVGLEAGKINVKSRWIGIDPNDGKVNSALDLVEKYRKKRLNVDDPRGYVVVSVQDNKIVAEHYSPNAEKLETYTGESAVEIKDQLRQDAAISNSDHNQWIGYELARAHLELHGELPEL